VSKAPRWRLSGRRRDEDIDKPRLHRHYPSDRSVQRRPEQHGGKEETEMLDRVDPIVVESLLDSNEGSANPSESRGIQ